MSLQRSAGNRAVLRLLQRQKATPAASDSTLATAGDPTNPLVGLKTGDGLSEDTVELRPRVLQLQNELNRHMQANLKLDGLFGPHTTRVLAEFQDSIRITEQNPVDQTTADALLLDISPGAQQPADLAPSIAVIQASLSLLQASADAGVSATGYLRAAVLVGNAGANLVRVSVSLTRVAGALGDASRNLARLVAANELGNPLVGLTLGDGFGSIRLENRRPRIKLLQSNLNEKQAAGLNVDGFFGPATLAVLNLFQQVNGLPQQDFVDPDCADLLLDRTGPTTTMNLSPAGVLFAAAAQGERDISLALLASPTFATASSAEFAEARDFTGVAIALTPLLLPVQVRTFAEHAMALDFLTVNSELTTVSNELAQAGVLLQVSGNSPPNFDVRDIIAGQALLNASVSYTGVANTFGLLAAAFLGR